MKKKIFKFVLIILILNITSNVYSNTNFFNKAKKYYDDKNYEKAKFFLEKNIVYNPRHHQSYLYLAKIHKEKENDLEEKKNLKTTLLLNSKNEEALYMLIELHLKNSDFSKVKELLDRFSLICSNLCINKKKIQERIKVFEVSNDS